MKLLSHNVQPSRNGTIAVLFAIALPVLLVIAAIAINVAQMQLTRTELKIATDAAARAGGRGWSEFQDIDRAKEFAAQAAALNTVGGEPLILGTNEADGQIIFGDSRQTGDSRFRFTTLTEAEVADGSFVSGIQVQAAHETPLFFEVSGIGSFSPVATSIASQVERDIALVIDRSGSMAYFEGRDTDPGKGEDFLFETLGALFNDTTNNISDEEFLAAMAAYQGVAKLEAIPLAERVYSDNIVELLTGDLKQYALSVNSDYHPGTGAPDFSRWHALKSAYEAFFEVLDSTDQEELVSVASFASAATLDAELSSNYENARTAIDGMRPDGSTQIGTGMWEAYLSLRDGGSRQQGAIQTLIVFTDGVNRDGISPLSAARQIIADNPTTVIHTVTFGTEADRSQMAAVADLTTGIHYHASDVTELEDIFRELAGSQRTLITQ